MLIGGSMLQKVRRILRKEGSTAVLDRGAGFAYRGVVRPWLPPRAVNYAGIAVSQDRRWGDQFIPSTWLPPNAAHQSEYEAALVSGLIAHVRQGDRVVVIGGGLGVTATIAALRAGPFGQVECFEGGKECVMRVRRTATLNGVTNLIVHHAVVASSIAVYGMPSDAGVVLPPDHLPPCDVLELDCEGAEVQILREMEIQPRVILVETHGIYQAPTSLVFTLLEQRGYTVSDLGCAEPRLLDQCMQNDIRVLLGIKPANGSADGKPRLPTSRPTRDRPRRRQRRPKLGPALG